MTESSRVRTVGNRLCLDFVNLPFEPGDAMKRPVSWQDLVRFLAETGIVSAERGEELQSLPETDSMAANNLLFQSERLANGIRFALRAVARNGHVHREWIEPINEVLRVTEGHDELDWDGSAWRIAFVSQKEGLAWLLAATARSAAELIAAGPRSRVRQCANPNCQLLFYDDSRTHRRRWCSMALCGNRSKVAAFARRQIGSEKAKAHHA